MAGHLSVGERWRIVSLRFDQSESVRETARRINCSTRCVYNILQLFEETGDVRERTGRGRFTILTDEQIYTLRQLFYRYTTDTAHSIAQRLYQRIGVSVDPRTIRNYRVSLGFHPVHARIQPCLKGIHAERRLNFCLSNLSSR